MRYFLIAGEASGDLHAAHLMRALRDADPEAEFRFFGGDLMQAEGGECLLHYRDLAFMGFIPVLLHLPTILRGLRTCKAALRAWRPDCVILVDYPGFNLKIARFVHEEQLCPVYYYISPKIWAWKERRIKDIRRTVTRLFSILPFEVDFFERRHAYPISYVGNPTVDEVAAFRASYAESRGDFCTRHRLDATRPVIALLAGSRQQEIRDNLGKMCRSCAPFVAQGYQLALAAAPSIDEDFYDRELRRLPAAVRPVLVRRATYPLLAHAHTALVTSGTATLETALFDVPQIVCYYIPFGRIVRLLRRWFLRVPFISLVNLVCRREVVPELVADAMNETTLTRHLSALLPEGAPRAAQLRGYAEMRAALGEPGAPERAAREMVRRLRAAPPAEA